VTLAYPLSLPGATVGGHVPRLLALSFDVDSMLAYAPEGGGGGASVSLAQPRWVAEYETTVLREPHTSEWAAFRTASDIMPRTFYARDPSRTRPRAYPDGLPALRAAGVAFDGTSAYWSLDTARTTLHVEFLPGAFVISTNDLIGFRWGAGKRALVQVLQGAPASNVGIWEGPVWPPLPSWLPSDAVVHFVAPECIMQPVPGSFAPLRVTAGNRTVARFQAREHLVP
jgi:hypothetical protein